MRKIASHRNACRAFTLVEVMVVLAVIGLSAAIAAYYGPALYDQYTFSSFVRSIEDSISVAKMRAKWVHSGNRVILRFTSAEELHADYNREGKPFPSGIKTTYEGLFYERDGKGVIPNGGYFLVAPRSSQGDAQITLKGNIELELLYNRYKDPDTAQYDVCLKQDDGAGCSDYYSGDPDLPENRELRFNSQGYLADYRPIRIVVVDAKRYKLGDPNKKVVSVRTTNLCITVTALGEVERAPCNCGCP